MDGDDSTLAYFKAGYCAGIVAGYSMAVQLAAIKFDVHVACLPSEFSTDQGVRVVVKYINDHPEALHLSATVLVGVALNDVFRCSN